jgi:hypothetical protein
MGNVMANNMANGMRRKKNRRIDECAGPVLPINLKRRDGAARAPSF